MLDGVANVVVDRAPGGRGLASTFSLAGLVPAGNSDIQGGAYTYLNTKTGTEFSATLGFTGNFTNPSTNYTNGLDSHLDLAASQFLNQQLFVGAVGYVYQQLTPNRGQRAILGSNASRTRGVGPQAGYNFNVNGTTIFTNLRAYWEFDSYRRLQGHSGFVTVNLPLSGFVAKPQSR